MSACTFTIRQPCKNFNKTTNLNYGSLVYGVATDTSEEVVCIVHFLVQILT